MVNIVVSPQEFSQILLQSQPWHGSRSWQQRQIHRVPAQLRLRRKGNEHLYDPTTVSLGPYHHGKPELQRAQEFKYLCLHWCALGNDERKRFFYNKILEQVDYIRGCYADVSCVNRYDDRSLAFMMLLDACFIINFMETQTGIGENNFHEWRKHLGLAMAIPFTARDIMVLENQIPFQVIEHLTSLRHGKEKGRELIHKFLEWTMIAQSRIIPKDNEEPPLHILEACYRVIVEQIDCSDGSSGMSVGFMWQRLKKGSKKNYHRQYWSSQTGRSVMDLKAKGFHLRPSTSTSLRDIKFKSYAFSGQLQLPVRYISERTRVIFSNMIAYEMSPDSNTDLVVLSYTSFMKSLIESPNDVKELQEKGILFNKLINHEDVVKLFKEIDTFEFFNSNIIADVNERITEHCNSKTKTWMADLVHTWFRSPWTVIALLATTFLLCLTFLQTYFTVHPAKGT